MLFFILVVCDFRILFENLFFDDVSNDVLIILSVVLMRFFMYFCFLERNYDEELSDKFYKKKMVIYIFLILKII